MTNLRQALVRRLTVALGASLLLAGAANAGHGRNHPQRNEGARGAPPSGETTPAVPDKLTPAESGQTVYDSKLNVTWLADANYAHTKSFGIDGITGSGAMSYTAAVAWVAKLNSIHYLNHTNWTLPATPKQDSTCAKTGPNENGFGVGCHGGDLGSLYYDGLGLNYPATAVSRPPSSSGSGFRNFQNYLYWSQDSSGHTGVKGGENKNAYASFSFTAGYKGSNVAPNYLYAMAMVPGKPATGFPPGSTVYDPTANITWLADADLVRSLDFGVDHNADGAMTHDAAMQWIRNMNSQHYLGHTGWQLPPTPPQDPSCSINKKVPTYAFNCTGGAMGKLYYGFLHKTAGESVVPPMEAATGPFRNIQPYLYWSCLGPTQPLGRPNPVLQQPKGRHGGRRGRDSGGSDGAGGGGSGGDEGLGQGACGNSPAATDFQFSFSFGNGFQGTDILENDLYVMVYYPGPPPGLTPPKAPPGGTKCTGRACATM